MPPFAPSTHFEGTAHFPSLFTPHFHSSSTPSTSAPPPTSPSAQPLPKRHHSRPGKATVKQAGKHGEGLETLHPHWPWAANSSATLRMLWVLQEVVSEGGALQKLSAWVNIMEKFWLTAFLKDISITLDISHLSRKGEGNSNPAPAARAEQKPSNVTDTSGGETTAIRARITPKLHKEQRVKSCQREQLLFENWPC